MENLDYAIKELTQTKERFERLCGYTFYSVDQKEEMYEKIESFEAAIEILEHHKNTNP